MSTVSDQVKQAEMLGAVATIYRAEGWLVVALHRNLTQPTQASGPDLLVLRGTEARAIKVYGAKGKPSEKQTKVRAIYEGAGIDYLVYTPDDFKVAAEDASCA